MIFRKLRNWLLAGLVVLLPVWLTLWMVLWVFNNLDAAVSAPLKRYTGFDVPGIGVLLLLLFMVLVGWLTTHLLGQKLIEIGDRIMLRVPVVKAIYSAVKQVTDAVMGPKDRAFSRVVLLEYPRRNVFCLGFVAGEFPEADLLRLWVAQGPWASAGPVVLVHADEVVQLPMTVEDGLKYIVSAGVLTPKETDVGALAHAVAELRRRHEMRGE
ncbi:MAG TPA: DUF502 domain-containing protein [Symbiobacteriaceae bacterium]|nr:DUF502 domain-containing protein [Symbiobacteriaceae bacterium]